MATAPLEAREVVQVVGTLVTLWCLALLALHLTAAPDASNFWGTLPSAWDHPEPNYLVSAAIGEFWSVLTTIPVAGALLFYEGCRFQYGRKVMLIYGLTCCMYSLACSAHLTLQRHADELGIFHSDVQDQLKHVREIQASRSAFAAVLADGSIVAWGNAREGGDMSVSIREQLRDVQELQASDGAFAARLADGSVVTWGSPRCGGDCSQVQAQLKGVRMIRAAGPAFAACLEDRSVVTWGNPRFGGDNGKVCDVLKGVQDMQASRGAFASILLDGSVVSWGNPGLGGDSSKVRDQLTDVQTIQSTDSAFAALLANQSIVTWGDPYAGGDSSQVQDQLKDVKKLRASSRAFAAVLLDGSVITWGDAETGGDSSKVQDQLKNVQEVTASGFAFAGLLADGSVVTWGNSYEGGDCRLVRHLLNDVQQIHASRSAFAAVLANHSLVTAVMSNALLTFVMFSHVVHKALQSLLLRGLVVLVAETLLVTTVACLPYMIKNGGVWTLFVVQAPGVFLATGLAMWMALRSTTSEEKTTYRLVSGSGMLLSSAMVLSLVECLIGFEWGFWSGLWGFPYLHVAIHLLEQFGIYVFGVGVAALEVLLLRPKEFQHVEVRSLGKLSYLYCELKSTSPLLPAQEPRRALAPLEVERARKIHLRKRTQSPGVAALRPVPK
eukprot:g17926.t2